MRKTTSIYKQLNNKKKAFTLIELLIVIAIIGILFIVLVSKVDFATDKAKATGVQTDFRSFQMALDTVAKENAGFNTFGFDTGDNAGTIPAGYAFVNEDAKKATMGDGIRNSYDEGDKNLNGKQDVNGKDGYTGTTEVFTGRKIYTEKWTDVWTLVKPGTTGYDADAIFALESAINKNLDPKLHITIASDGKITMANQARDPWKNEYHGYYITNAEADKGDRGAIVMYSNGANGKWGSAHIIENGVVTVGVPGNNVDGKDDYSFVSCYTFTNGYGEVLNATTGFSNNQSFQGAGINNTPSVVPGGNGGNAGGAGNTGNNSGETPNTPDPTVTYEMLDKPTATITLANPITFRSSADKSKFVSVKVDGVTVSNSYYIVRNGSTIVSLYGEYVNELSNGAHTIEIVSTDGTAKANFNVQIECREHEDYYYDEYDDEYYYGDDSYCDNCGIVWCWETGSCIDDNNDCVCDWCGYEAFHNDGDGDCWCDGCGKYECWNGDCMDFDNDCFCDGCDSEMHEFVDYACRNCQLLYCDYDGCHLDDDYDGKCDACQEHYYCIDDDYEGHCDVCNNLVCADGMFCESSDGDCYCDCCGSNEYEWLHDFSGGQCMNCGQFVCDIMRGHSFNTDGHCEYCDYFDCAYGNCVDDNGDCECDCCGYTSDWMHSRFDDWCQNCGMNLCSNGIHDWKNNYCLSCGQSYCIVDGSHYDPTNDGYCDGCGEVWCYDSGIHHDDWDCGYCNCCYTEMCSPGYHPDNSTYYESDDGSGWDAEPDGKCDICFGYICEVDGSPNYDINDYCESCGRHRDEHN